MAPNPANSKSRAHRVAAVAWLALAAIAVTAIGACATQPAASSPVARWASTDGGGTGTMTLRTDGGAEYSGPFLQMNGKLKSDSLEPMWQGWFRGWDDWKYGDEGYPADVYSGMYFGKVIANLKGPDAQMLRCRFRVNDRAVGIASGGDGECQFRQGRTINVTIQHS